MKLATAAEMRELDRRTIEEFGIPGIVLMENAGRAVVSAIVHKWGPVEGKFYCIFCGKGNNGGDGLVIARRLHNMGAKVSVRLFSEVLKGDAATNLNAARKIGIQINPVKPGLAEETSEAAHAEAVIDAIFGTGLSQEIAEPYASVIKMINKKARKVVAVDVPSGVNSDSGRIMGTAVHADMTVTFGLPKRGLYLHPGAQASGEVKTAEIGIPKSAVDEAAINAHLLTKRRVQGLLPERKPDSHKGTYGHLLIIAGSAGKTGAGVLAARAALRCGVGLVTVAVPESLNDIFEEKLTEEMTVGLPETDERSLSYNALDKLLELLEGKTAAAIGPGISRNGDTARLVRELLPRVKIPVVLDADALNILSEDETPLDNMTVPVILTPHPAEAGRLLGIHTVQVQTDRPGAALELAKAHHCTVALKGARTLIASPDGKFYVNPTGNPGMATAGTGDVLTGVVSSFLAQGLDAGDAALLGVYAHGLAGDIASDEKGQAGLIAGDLIEALPMAIRTLARGGD
jgi:ADP-dependent NAD(P)H-hydrate dehydratase / NAD(P)H-hydrate epimerase